MKTGAVVLGAAATLVIAVAAFAHGGATGIVKERMDVMEAMGSSIKALLPMMQGDIAYDAEAVRRSAEDIGAHSASAMTRLFPEGSGGPPSEAKSVIWEDWEEFSALAERLLSYSEGLALAADNGLSDGQGATMDASSMMGATPPVTDATVGREELAELPADTVFDLVGQTCSACHTKFRAEPK